MLLSRYYSSTAVLYPSDLSKGLTSGFVCPTLLYVPFVMKSHTHRCGRNICLSLIYTCWKYRQRGQPIQDGGPSCRAAAAVAALITPTSYRRFHNPFSCWHWAMSTGYQVTIYIYVYCFLDTAKIQRENYPVRSSIKQFHKRTVLLSVFLVAFACQNRLR